LVVVRLSRNVAVGCRMHLAIAAATD
jgi:polysaccharide pyruvyl transferase WcaK-like protein